MAGEHKTPARQVALPDQTWGIRRPGGARPPRGCGPAPGRPCASREGFVIQIISWATVGVVWLLAAEQAARGWRRRQIWHGLWAVALLGLSVAATLQTLAATGWTVTWYRWYYLAASIPVGVMGAASLFLGRRRRPAHWFLVIVAALAAALAAAVFLSPVNAAALAEGGPRVGGGAMPLLPRVLFITMSTLGAAVLLASAVSNYLASRAVSHLWLLAGVLLLSLAGTASTTGHPAAFVLANFAGFLGIWVGGRTARPVTPVRPSTRK